MPHTPGPWIAKDTGCGFVQIKSAGSIEVISYADITLGGEEQRDNIKLIMDVPELLEALRDVIDSDMAMRSEDEGARSELLERIRALIAKHEGK